MTSKNRIFLNVFFLGFILSIAVCISDSAYSKNNYQSTNTTYWGLNTTTIVGPEGKVNVYLPDDIAIGDTISGTVVAEPYGADEYERNENSDVLNGYVVELKTPDKKLKKSKVGVNDIAKITIPPAASTALTMILKDGKGKIITKSDLQVYTTPAAFENPNDFAIPPIGQSGRPIEIKGPFDGSLDTTSLKLNNKKAKVLAESPRKTVAQTPRNLVGQVDVELKENNIATKGKINMLSINLSAPKTTLLKGEETSITLRVKGFGGLSKDNYPVPIEVTNLTPQVIRMSESIGNSIATGIEATQVKSGQWTEEFKVVGITPGHFSVAATVYYVSIHNNFKGNMNMQEFLEWLAVVKAMWEQEIKDIDNEKADVEKKGEKWPDTAKARGRQIRKGVLVSHVDQLKIARWQASDDLKGAKDIADKLVSNVNFIGLGAELVTFATDLLGYQDIPVIRVSTVLKGLGTMFKAKDYAKILNAINAAEKVAKAYENVQDAKAKAQKLKELDKKVKKVKELIEEQK